ncbi:TPA: twitching motility protein [Candidatus Edwardsbacteria bacterium]|nr:twitching motility protein [Candidatus Edwardsbacteria bacterium]
MDLKRTLERMVKENASDLHLKAGLPPVLRIDGFLRPLEEPPLSPEELRQVALQLMPKDQQQLFADEKELDFSMGVAGLGRFRVNVYMQRGSVALAMRAIPFNIKKVDELMLPPITKELALSNRGLLLVTGTTGSGKSTTLASMLEFINETENRNIITVEDPIEFIFRDKKSLISQREIGTDTKTFAAALKHVLRQDPDVILIGEIRDKTTLATALQAADTGHLVMTTLHSTNAYQSIVRILDFYPHDEHDAIRNALSLNISGVICQRLIPRAYGGGVAPSVEIMINTPIVKKLIEDNKLDKLPAAIESGKEDGMQSFNQSLLGLVNEGLITEEDALKFANNPEALKMNLKGIFLDSSSQIIG